MTIQCAGRGTNDDIISLTKEIMRSNKWSRYFQGYSSPHGHYGPEEYHAWLDQVGLEELKASLTVKDLILPGKTGLEGFIRTTWISVIERIPEWIKPQFISVISDKYLERHPLEDGLAVIEMAVLDVEARNPD